MLLRFIQTATFATTFFLSLLFCQRVPAAVVESRLPTPAGLEGAIEFWKQVFSLHDSGTVLFFDPYDAGTIYSTLRVADDLSSRAVIEKERTRIVAEYDLNEEDGRLRTQRGGKEQFLLGLRIAGRYLPEMKRIFRDANLPTDLAYLPLVESSFNLRARSPVGAAGIWQFMPDTGRKFMRIDDTVDERLDPIASTRAAARLLKENYQILGSWPLAITAYNHGTEGIFRAIETTGSRNLADMIRRYKSPTFGFASQSFYAELLAVVYLAKNSERYFPFLRVQHPAALRELALTQSVSLDTLLKAAAIAPKNFFEWNPAIGPALTTLPVGYRINVAPEKFDAVMATQRRLAQATTAGKNLAQSKPAVVITRSSGKELPLGRGVSARANFAKASRTKTARVAVIPPRLKVAKGRNQVLAPAG